MRPLDDAEIEFLGRARDQRADLSRRLEGAAPLTAALIAVASLFLAAALARLLALIGIPDDLARMVALVVGVATGIVSREVAEAARRRERAWAIDAVADLDAAIAEGSAAVVVPDPDGLDRVLADPGGRWIGSLHRRDGVPVLFLPAPPRRLAD